MIVNQPFWKVEEVFGEGGAQGPTQCWWITVFNQFSVTVIPKAGIFGLQHIEDSGDFSINVTLEGKTLSITAPWFVGSRFLQIQSWFKSHSLFGFIISL